MYIHTVVRKNPCMFSSRMYQLPLRPNSAIIQKWTFSQVTYTNLWRLFPWFHQPYLEKVRHCQLISSMIYSYFLLISMTSWLIFTAKSNYLKTIILYMLGRKCICFRRPTKQRFRNNRQLVSKLACFLEHVKNGMYDNF